ncbi:MAG: hypothetical protein ACAH59_03305 [Pseudobdellovibrionaceae bacterium]
MSKNQCLALIALSAITLSFGYQNCSKVGVQDLAATANQKIDGQGVQVIPPDEISGAEISGGSSDGGGSSTAGTMDGGSSTGGEMTGGTSTAGTMDGGSSTGGEMTGGTSTAGTMDGGSSTGGEMTGGTSTAGTMDGGSSTGGEMTGGASIAGDMNGGASNGGSNTGSETPQQPTPPESELVAECLKQPTIKLNSKKNVSADSIVGLKGGGVVQANSVPLVDKSTGKLVIVGTGENPSLARVESHNGSLIICNMTVDHLGKETGNLVLVNSHVKYLAPERRSTTHFLNSTIDNADQVRGNIHELKH